MNIKRSKKNYPENIEYPPAQTKPIPAVRVPSILVLPVTFNAPVVFV